MFHTKFMLLFINKIYFSFLILYLQNNKKRKRNSFKVVDYEFSAEYYCHRKPNINIESKVNR